MPLALASVSHHANNIINVKVAFFRSYQLRRGVTWLFFVMWCHWHQYWYHIMPLALISCDVSVLVSVSCDVDSTINSAIAFLQSKWSKDVQDDFSGHVTQFRCVDGVDSTWDSESASHEIQVSVLPVGWLCNILREDVNSMHCYQLAWEQLEFGVSPVWDV